ncbi:MAG: glycosyl transferase family 28 [Clostridiales bacterium]|uniref:PssE/Cps14G family polysaccharide biosynthesis glycosyltransferase n=1 Tax=Caproiciproducens sp. MSJ-32 TaxID=2841527 RepID=UPI00168FB4BB|nr:PssE/Cps14G family polysaccharide biosynthesis glycosyltransferase [Caproiciproducens sp. MSJ-32]MBU5454189.1 glycosyl transferase family 28 [Caproiciproducens sp. MSJ-32]NLM05236.1 glycosyl transferase family 28 [Clostridiales bacterium]
MIFITVGTHEQQFNRLVKEVDKLKESGVIKEDVFIQLGYSDYIPKNCEWKKMISYDEMDNYIRNSRIVITHGGPGSIFQCINYNKTPIVVPRNPEYDEHVDNHQIEFVRKLNDKKSVIGIEDISELENIIINYTALVSERESHGSSNVENFNKKLSVVIKDIMCR